MWEHLGSAATVTIVVFNIATAGFGILLLLSQLRMKVALKETEAILTATIGSSRKEVEERVETQGRQFGEVATAIRQKVNEVELFCRDTFIRRDSFYEANKANNETISSLGAEIKTRLERMEQKIDDRA